MQYPIGTAHSAPELSKQDRYALISYGIWLRIGFIATFGLLGVMVQMFNGEMKPLSALVLAIAAGTLAAASWWRASAILGIAEGANVATPAASSSARTAVAGSVA